MDGGLYRAEGWLRILRTVELFLAHTAFDVPKASRTCMNNIILF